SIWMAQIRALKMEPEGMQRYSDQFIGLANKLNLDLSDGMTIYQFKMGLSAWMLDQLSVAESNHLLAMKTQESSVRPISVEILVKLAIRIEANKRMQGASNYNAGSNDRNLRLTSGQKDNVKSSDRNFKRD